MLKPRLYRIYRHREPQSATAGLFQRPLGLAAKTSILLAPRFSAARSSVLFVGLERPRLQTRRERANTIGFLAAKARSRGLKGELPRREVIGKAKTCPLQQDGKRLKLENL